MRKSGFRHVLLLGMGGSNLCPDVLRLTFGEAAGFPKLAVLGTMEQAARLRGIDAIPAGLARPCRDPW